MTSLILPSILSANIMHLSDEIEAIIKAGADGVHLDVMDGHYVPNLTFGPAVCASLRHEFPELLIDVHLMTTPVDYLIQQFIASGASRISIHPDATIHLDRSLQMIKDAGIKAGLAINPATSIDTIKWCMHHLDFVLVMTVNPGFAGQKMINAVIPKITELHKAYPNLPIAVDGGVSATNIKQLTTSGATQFIAGNAIFNSADYAASIMELRQNAL